MTGMTGLRLAVEPVILYLWQVAVYPVFGNGLFMGVTRLVVTVESEAVGCRGEWAGNFSSGGRHRTRSLRGPRGQMTR